jgi:hypothetical protein
MKQSWWHLGFKLAFVFVGLFGVAFAISGVLTSLPAPAIGGTCGPGKGSETALEAFVEPGSIGAGVEPAASTTATGAEKRADWMAFVGECQSSTNSHVLSNFAIFVLAVGVGLGGSLLLLRRARPTVVPSTATPTPNLNPNFFPTL